MSVTGIRHIIAISLRGCAVFALGMWVGTAQAQVAGGEGNERGDRTGSFSDRSGSDGIRASRSAFRTLSSARSARLRLLLERAGSFCSRVEDESYRVDCLAERFQAIADEVATSGDYAGAGRAIGDTARKLSALAQANRDTTRPTARLRAPGGTRSTRDIVPVVPARNAAVKERAAEIIDEGVTQLLRSGRQSERRRVAYSEVAQGFETNKILLRSS